MTTIRSYTNLEQSKKLAKILSLESADMFYNKEPEDETYPKDIADTKYPMILREGPICFLEEYGIPCWSLSALISIIPQELFDGEYVVNITEGIDNKWIITYDDFEDRNHSHYGLSTSADNLVDACVAMIEKLNELSLLRL